MTSFDAYDKRASNRASLRLSVRHSGKPYGAQVLIRKSAPGTVHEGCITVGPELIGAARMSSRHVAAIIGFTYGSYRNYILEQ
jgi:hypothetical protein